MDDESERGLVLTDMHYLSVVQDVSAMCHVHTPYT